jgi:hypothetical protein
MLQESTERRSRETWGYKITMQYGSREQILSDIDPLYAATRGFLSFCQQIFKIRDAGSWKWSENPEESEILIADFESDVGSQGSLRPRIITQRAPAVVVNSGRDQVLSRNLGGTEQTLAFILQSSLTFNCISREGVEAQKLAYFLLKMIIAFKPTIMRIGDIHFISNQVTMLPETGHGELFPGSSSPEWKVVRLIVPFAVQDTMKITEDFHSILRDVTTEIESGI